MKITNPTANEISMQYKGVVYTVPAEATVSGFAEDVATYWKTMIHHFILVSDEGAADPMAAVKVEEVVETPVEVAPVEEVVEEVVEAPVSTIARKLGRTKK